MFDVNAYIKRWRKRNLQHIVARFFGEGIELDPELPDILYWDLTQPIVCADGFVFSVQASAYHHCVPKNNTGPYSMVECGFADHHPPVLWGGEAMPHTDDPRYEDNKIVVYSYVEIKHVAELVEQHGGLKKKLYRWLVVATIWVRFWLVVRAVFGWTLLKGFIRPARWLLWNVALFFEHLKGD